MILAEKIMEENRESGTMERIGANVCCILDESDKLLRRNGSQVVIRIKAIARIQVQMYNLITSKLLHLVY